MFVISKEIIEKMSVEEQIELVIKHASAIKKIENPDYSVQCAFVKAHPWHLGYIKEPSHALMWLAVKTKPSSIEHWINNFLPEDVPVELIEYALERSGSSIVFFLPQFVTESLKILAARSKPSVLVHYGDNPSMEAILAAFETDMEIALKCLVPEKIATLPEDLLLRAVRDDGNNIRFIERPNAQLQQEAVKQNKRAIRYIKKEDVCPELQEFYKEDRLAYEAAREKDLKRKSNALLRRF